MEWRFCVAIVGSCISNGSNTQSQFISMHRCRQIGGCRTFSRFARRYQCSLQGRQIQGVVCSKRTQTVIGSKPAVEVRNREHSHSHSIGGRNQMYRPTDITPRIHACSGRQHHNRLSHCPGQTGKCRTSFCASRRRCLYDCMATVLAVWRPICPHCVLWPKSGIISKSALARCFG